MGKTLSQLTAQRISYAFPDLNINWVQTGEGSMLVDDQSIQDESVTIPTKNIVPLIPISAMAGSLTGFDNDGIRRNDCEKIISPIDGAEFGVPITGESMAPEFPNGSNVLVKKIDEKAFIEWGRTYVLDTTNGAVIKKLAPSEKGENYVRCISVNPDPIFAPFDVCLNDVRGIYRVMICMAIK